LKKKPKPHCPGGAPDKSPFGNKLRYPMDSDLSQEQPGPHELVSFPSRPYCLIPQKPRPAPDRGPFGYNHKIFLYLAFERPYINQKISEKLKRP